VRIVEQGVAQLLEIQSGETLFIKFYDPAGKESGSTGSTLRCGWADPQLRADWIAFHGEGWTARAWNWFGEVTDSWGSSLSMRNVRFPPIEDISRTHEIQ
jgi:hypothetical protein